MKYNEGMVIDLTDKKVIDYISNTGGTVYRDLVEIPNNLNTRNNTKITKIQVIKYYDFGKHLGIVAYLDSYDKLHLIQPISYVNMYEQHLRSVIPTEIIQIKLGNFHKELLDILMENHIGNKLNSEEDIKYFNESLENSSDTLFFLGENNELIEIRPTQYKREIQRGHKYFNYLSEKLVLELLQPFNMYDENLTNYLLPEEELKQIFGKLPTKENIEKVKTNLGNHLNKIEYKVLNKLECQLYCNDNFITLLLVELLIFDEIEGIVRDSKELQQLFHDSKFMREQLLNYRVSKMTKEKQEDIKFISKVKRYLDSEYKDEINLDSVNLDLFNLIEGKRELVQILQFPIK